MAESLDTRPNEPRKADKEGNNTEGKNTANLEELVRTTATATIKRKTRGESDPEEKKMVPRDKPDPAIVKRLGYEDKQ